MLTWRLRSRQNQSIILVGGYRLQHLALARMRRGSKFERAPSFCPNISRKKTTDRDETFKTLASINFTPTLKILTPWPQPKTTFTCVTCFSDHVWPESRFSVYRLALAFRLQTFCVFKRSMWYDASLMHDSECQGHLKVRSLTCDEALLVARLVFGADFKFSNHLNTYEVDFVPI